MRATAAKAGTLGGAHTLSDWANHLVPNGVPNWLSVSLWLAAIAILFLATWHLLPSALNWLRKAALALAAFHKRTNEVFGCLLKAFVVAVRKFRDELVTSLRKLRKPRSGRGNRSKPRRRSPRR
jgi:chromate transport protein ChrA